MASQERAHRAWRNAERIKMLSDRIVGVGPIGIGLDGVLSWVPIPFLDTAYSIGAGSLLMIEGISARAGPGTLLRMLAYLLLDSAASLPPFLAAIIDPIFQGHLLAAGALQKDIEARHGPSVVAPGRKAMLKRHRGKR